MAVGSSRWGLHATLLAVGVVAGVVVTVWDYASSATKCSGPLACIDYTGAASTGYWIVFGIQATVSSAAMLFFVRSPRRFFRSHVTAAGALLACISLAWIVLLAQPAKRASAAPTSWTCPVDPNEHQSALKPR